ncbi:MerR family transcriptional regulator [Micromonospora chokoriensis]
MRIGELSSRTGVSVRSLRYYEEQGLLSSTRTSGGHRDYTDEALHRVGCLRKLYGAGMSSRAIAALMPCSDAPSDGNTEVAFESLVYERDKLNAHIGDLLAARDSVEELIAANRAFRANRERTV